MPTGTGGTGAGSTLFLIKLKLEQNGQTFEWKFKDQMSDVRRLRVMRRGSEIRLLRVLQTGLFGTFLWLVVQQASICVAAKQFENETINFFCQVEDLNLLTYCSDGSFESFLFFECFLSAPDFFSTCAGGAAEELDRPLTIVRKLDKDKDSEMN